MNVLVLSVPGAGHINPLLPLIKAFHAQGDSVVVASGTDIAAVVEQAGAELCPAGRGEDAWFDELRGRVRGFPGDGLAPERINHYFVPRLFAEIAAADMIDDVVACGRKLRPDLIVFETYAFAGPLAAALLGVLGVHHLVGAMLDREVLALANDALSPLWRSFGVDVPGYAGVYRDVTITICPPSLEALDVPAGELLSLRPVPLPLLGSTPTGRPLVYVTLGTVFNASLDVFRTVLAGLADEPVDVVVTIGATQDPAALRPVPGNAQVERFIPQATLLPRCAAVVHHAGSGTMMGALGHGLPQVLIPQGADNFNNASLLERAGIGRALRPGAVTPENVRQAVRQVLDEPSYGASARRAAAEIAAMPSAADVAAALRVRVNAGRGAFRDVDRAADGH
jgi:UDP:flavonoid glycosyltransferase YjiC (YdhE family)